MVNLTLNNVRPNSASSRPSKGPQARPSTGTNYRAKPTQVDENLFGHSKPQNFNPKTDLLLKPSDIKRLYYINFRQE
jgi:hypothetical protein